MMREIMQLASSSNSIYIKAPTTISKSYLRRYGKEMRRSSYRRECQVAPIPKLTCPFTPVGPFALAGLLCLVYW